MIIAGGGGTGSIGVQVAKKIRQKSNILPVLYPVIFKALSCFTAILGAFQVFRVCISFLSFGQGYLLLRNIRTIVKHKTLSVRRKKREEKTRSTNGARPLHYHLLAPCFTPRAPTSSSFKIYSLIKQNSKGRQQAHDEARVLSFTISYFAPGGHAVLCEK